ncbi:GIP, partial [Symbiodinium natans]
MPAPPPMPPPRTMEQEEPRGFLRSWLTRPRSESPPPRPDHPRDSPAIEALTKGIAQLQELQAQALQKSSGNGAEVIKPGTSTLSPLPTVKSGAEVALQFQDWVEVTAAVMYDISEQSGTWWRAVLGVVDRAYKAWLSSTPLERLTVQPRGGEELATGKWTRLNARVTAMLLAAMSEEQKMDMIANRISTSSVDMLFRLYTTYQPGGSLERQDVLKRLQSPMDYVDKDTIQEVLRVVRSWPRWMARCETLGMAAPDPSVLARGLKLLTAKYIDSNPDSAFRTAMLRTTLRLDGQPGEEQVRAYQKHLQAELENVAASCPSGSTTAEGLHPRLQALDRGEPRTAPTSKSPEKDKEKGGKTDMCRYFMKPSGCRRGSRCNFSHNMAHLDREVRKKKCLSCGSESHRQKDCGVGKSGPRPPHGPTGSEASGGGAKSLSTTPGVASLSTTSTTGATDGSVVQGTPWTLETLVQAAQQVMQAQAPGDRGESPEKTGPAVRTLVVRGIQVCAMKSSSTALLDSGATHCLRSARSYKEWSEAEKVMVQLAGNHNLVMRMSDNGSLLMPPRKGMSETGTGGDGGQTIVPMGELVGTLGYTLRWSPTECYLYDKSDNRIPLSVSGGCPQLCEAEALSLIAKIEDKRREVLENEIAETQDLVAMAALQLDKGWKDYIREYVATGSLDAGLRSLRDAPFLKNVSEECLRDLVQDEVKDAGWEVFKGVDFLTRPQKRYLWGSKKWVIHLFAGDPGHYKMFQLDQGNTAVLELDIARCQGHSILRSPTWRLLMWGALNGRIGAVLGGPPGRSARFDDDGDDQAQKALKVITRMMWLYVIAKEARAAVPMARNKERPVAFALEHPASRGSGSLWSTDLWEEFQEEMDMIQEEIPNVKVDPEWSPGLVDSMVMAMRLWDQQPLCCPARVAISPGEWQRHVCSGHADYRRDCLTCVMARGTGRRHARARHPSTFVLTIDLAGPVKPGLDVTSKGTMGKNLRYMLVAKYVLPKEYVKGYTGRQPPGDDGREDEPPQGLEGEESHMPVLAEEEDPFEVGESMDYESDVDEAQSQEEDACEVERGDSRFAGGTTKQREEFRDYEDVMYEPSEIGPDDEGGGEDQEEQVHLAEEDQVKDSEHRAFPDCECPDEKGKEKFIHTFHVRPRLIDPGLPHEELQVEEAPAPKRRVVGKTPLESIEMRRMELSEEELGSYVRDRCKVLLENWDRGVALQVVDEVAETGFFDDKKFGVYRHGGTVGWLRGLHEHPELTRVLTRIVTEINPEANYMAIWVARNAERGMHKDSNNDEKAFNTVIPVRTPAKGGDLWVELSPGDIVTGEVMEREDDQGRRRYGQVHRIRAGSCMTFLPRKLHEVLPWSGTRTVLIAYTPNCFGSLSREMIQSLEDYGFLPPPSQLPEYFLKKGEAAMNYMEVDSQEPGEVVQKEEEVKDEEDESWEMFLEAENGMIKIGGSVSQQRCEAPSMKKMEPAFTKDVEDLLNDLVGPLEVTHNVDPREVEANWEKWIPAIMKELTSVSVAIQKLPLGSPERSEWIQRPGAQRLPTKMVYTIKPGDNPDIEDPSTWYKRKARLVVCGNFADRDQTDLYS